MLAMFVLIGIFVVIILVPCVGIAILGVNLMEKIGRYPSKTSAFQTSTFIKLFILEIISFGMLILTFHMLGDYK